MLLELMVARQPLRTLDFSLDVESYRKYLSKMMNTRNLYVDGVYQHPTACKIETKDDKKDVTQLSSIIPTSLAPIEM
jgi:hypothetical protein